MSRDKEVGEVVSAIISLVNNQYSFLVELLRITNSDVCAKEVGKDRSSRSDVFYKKRCS